MSTHRALILNSTSEPLSLQKIPIPQAGPGTAIIKILSTWVLPYLRSVLNGTLPYTLALPMIPGANCIGRIHSVGPDAISLKPGQLVLCDITVRARDDPSRAILMGLHGGGALELMEGEWRDGTLAEYAKFPLENVFALDEEILCGEMGYGVEDLCAIPGFLVPFGGLSEIEVLPGQTIIVAPATGKFGGGAVTTALALGAKVIACGRNEGTLNAIKKCFDHTGRITTVKLTGDVEKDTELMLTATGNSRGADAFIDFSPASVTSPTHIAAALAALKPQGRAAFMGGLFGKIEVDYTLVMMNSLRIQGRFMYEREAVTRFIGLVENGNLKLGEKGAGVSIVGKFGLEQIDEALDLAEKAGGWGKLVVLVP